MLRCGFFWSKAIGSVGNTDQAGRAHFFRIIKSASKAIVLASAIGCDAPKTCDCVSD